MKDHILSGSKGRLFDALLDVGSYVINGGHTAIDGAPIMGGKMDRGANGGIQTYVLLLLRR